MPKLACIEGVHNISTHGFTIEIGPFLLKGKKEGLRQTSERLLIILNLILMVKYMFNMWTRG